ncbi:WD40 repeat domain-containing protein [Paenibacillus sp. MZ04-78.2]|uniref:TolB family protein n=1 Tax=Paenibacillus sp. MZ04-78.2 TaxID=2962034 RepID=UPI0020B6856A|nr:WD40 repeat domain-containing protein [Paenibacillus sp. MZ04-78.2]MCP3775557.1 WD40 repeat domain-containing protein [Paenibacillus sp. MZ04-78.2]
MENRFFSHTMKWLVIMVFLAAAVGCEKSTENKPEAPQKDASHQQEERKPNAEPSQPQAQAPSQLPSESQSKSESEPQQTGAAQDIRSLSSLIPAGKELSLLRNGKKAVARGDLNKDGIDDLAIIVEDPKETMAERDLLLYFGNATGAYEQSIYAKKAILCKDCGGVNGDPLDDFSANNSTVLIGFHGGSNERWYSKYRFQYRDRDWFLIGYTGGSYHTTDVYRGEEEDINLLTGDFILKKSDKNDPGGKLIQTEKGKRPKRKLVKLSEFKGKIYDETVIERVEADKGNQDITPSPDRQFVFFTKEKKETNFIWNIDEAQPKEIRGIASRVGSAIWSPNSKWIMVDSGTSPIRTGQIVDPATGKIILEVNYLSAGKISFSPDNSRLLYARGSEELPSVKDQYVDEGRISIIVLDLGTSKEKIVKEGTETVDYYFPKWKDDHQISYTKTINSVLQGKLIHTDTQETMKLEE